MESKAKYKSVLRMREMPTRRLAKIYQETTDKRNRGPISLRKAEFRAKRVVSDYGPYLTMIKGTSHNKEL